MTFPEYLAKTGQTAYAFFTEHDLPKNGVYKAAKGRRVDYVTAKRILDATQNAVALESLLAP